MHENDHYDRKELIRMTSTIFNEHMTEEELTQRAELWYLADHSTDADELSALSASPYVEVRESVARNVHTSVKTLIALSKDEDWQVRETIVFNRNTPQSVLDALKYDENEFVHDAILRREKSGI